MTDPYRIALALVRLIAALNLFPAGALLAAGAIAFPLAFNAPVLAAIPYSLLTYGTVYLLSGLTMWGFSRNIARFVTKAFDGDPAIFS